MKKIPNNFIWEHKQLLLFFFFADMTDIALTLEKNWPNFSTVNQCLYPCHPSQHADRRQETSSLFDSSCKHFKAF